MPISMQCSTFLSWGLHFGPLVLLHLLYLGSTMLTTFMERVRGIGTLLIHLPTSSRLHATL